MSGSAESLFQLVCAHQRSTAVCSILLTHFFRDGNPYIGLVEFLVGAGLAEDGIQVFWLERLAGGRIQERQGLVGHHCLDVEVMGGNLGFREHEFFLFHSTWYFVV